MCDSRWTKLNGGGVIRRSTVLQPQGQRPTVGDDLSPGRRRVYLVDQKDQQAKSTAKLVHAIPEAC